MELWLWHPSVSNIYQESYTISHDTKLNYPLAIFCSCFVKIFNAYISSMYDTILYVINTMPVNFADTVTLPILKWPLLSYIDKFGLSHSLLTYQNDLLICTCFLIPTTKCLFLTFCLRSMSNYKCTNLWIHLILIFKTTDKNSKSKSCEFQFHSL